jgi:hypothetical protein
MTAPAAHNAQRRTLQPLASGIWRDGNVEEFDKLNPLHRKEFGRAVEPAASKIRSRGGHSLHLRQTLQRELNDTNAEYTAI